MEKGDHLAASHESPLVAPQSTSEKGDVLRSSLLPAPPAHAGGRRSSTWFGCDPWGQQVGLGLRCGGQKMWALRLQFGLGVFGCMVITVWASAVRATVAARLCRRSRHG